MSEMELNLLAKFFVLNNEYELLCKMYYLLIKQLQNLERQKVSLTTTILFDGQFECLTEKTIKKMTIKENEFILEMRTSLDSLFKVLAKMQDLLLESIKKARKTTRTLEPFDISACVFINLFDIILNEFLFVFLDDIVFNSIMAIETNSSVGDIRTTTSHSIDLNL